ncbi:actin-related protein 10 [Triplophysa dalaica]|uniref:actin-related protein 10 n=1 Tax=Triplophysa dalaica TaxID=1582913 RepID=UPI0024E00442|nr:actin-related protein 10 [Triplophysa dalaica]
MPLFEGLGSGGEKTAVVIDLGAAYTKCGFAGETGPRFILPSEIKRPGSQEAVRVVQYNINTEELYNVLKEFIHLLYFRHLLVNPRDRRVVIIESILCPSHFRETLSRVFFKHFEVPSVVFAPGHLMSIMTLGVQSALVMDCGYTETLVLPIYEGIPILSAWEALPLGGQALHKELRSLLCEQCTVDAGAGLRLPTDRSSISEDVVEDIKVRTCFVSDLSGGLKIQEAKFNMDGSAERPAPPPDVEYPLDGQKILHVKGSIRDAVAEMLFEQDNEEKSIATLLLDALVKCPIDTRKVLSENLVIVGGTAMLPGFLHRLLAEIRSLVEKPKYCDALATKSFRIHSPPAKPNCTAWLGGAIFGALQDILGSRSVSRDYYNHTGRIPDWCCLSSPPPDSVYEAGKTPPPLMKRAFSTEK